MPSPLHLLPLLLALCAVSGLEHHYRTLGLQPGASQDDVTQVGATRDKSRPGACQGQGVAFARRARSTLQVARTASGGALGPLCILAIASHLPRTCCWVHTLLHQPAGSGERDSDLTPGANLNLEVATPPLRVHCRACRVVIVVVARHPAVPVYFTLSLIQPVPLQAYRALSQRHHPDMPQGDVAKFHGVREAYEVLKGKGFPTGSTGSCGY